MKWVYSFHCLCINTISESLQSCDTEIIHLPVSLYHSHNLVTYSYHIMEQQLVFIFTASPLFLWILMSSFTDFTPLELFLYSLAPLLCSLLTFTLLFFPPCPLHPPHTTYPASSPSTASLSGLHQHSHYQRDGRDYPTLLPTPLVQPPLLPQPQYQACISTHTTRVMEGIIPPCDRFLLIFSVSTPVADIFLWTQSYALLHSQSSYLYVVTYSMLLFTSTIWHLAMTTPSSSTQGSHCSSTVMPLRFLANIFRD